MPFQGGDGLFPLAPEHVFPAQVVHVAVVLRVLLHGQFQQRQVLRPGLAFVRVVVQLHPRHGDHVLHQVRVQGEHLMHGMGPAVAVAGVDLAVPKNMAFPAVGEEIPGIAVGGPGGARGPGGLQQRPPAWMQHLVQVRAYADVRILRHQVQGAVPRRVKAPGVEALHRHLRPRRPQALHRIVRGAGVQDHHRVRLPHGRHPTLHKLAFVFANGIDADLHGAPSLSACFF